MSCPGWSSMQVLSVRRATCDGCSRTIKWLQVHKGSKNLPAPQARFRRIQTPTKRRRSKKKRRSRFSNNSSFCSSSNSSKRNCSTNSCSNGSRNKTTPNNHKLFLSQAMTTTTSSCRSKPQALQRRQENNPNRKACRACRMTCKCSQLSWGLMVSNKLMGTRMATAMVTTFIIASLSLRIPALIRMILRLLVCHSNNIPPFSSKIRHLLLDKARNQANHKPPPQSTDSTKSKKPKSTQLQTPKTPKFSLRDPPKVEKKQLKTRSLAKKTK